MENEFQNKIGVAYIRESTEEQDKGFSPENQKRSIEEYAKKHRIRIVEIYKDLVSGKYADKRPNFQRMINDAMKKKFEVVLVYHTSRFARNVREARYYKDLLRKDLKIDVISTTQSFGDFNDPSAFLSESMTEVTDELLSRQISFWVKSGFAEKRRQGKPLGNPPLGYYKKRIGFDPEKNRPIYAREWHIDKKEVAIVRRIFKMYATGNHSMQDIAHILTIEGHRTKLGHPFSYSSIKCTIPNKSYLGLVHSPRKNLPDLPSVYHKRIISDELFYKCQDVLLERKGRYGRPKAKFRFYLLQGLVYCYRCIKHMKGNENSLSRKMQPVMYCEYHKRTTKSSERLFYACKFHRENRTCEQLSVKCEIIDKQVIQFMSGLQLPEDIIKMTLEKLRETFKISQKDKKLDNRVPNLQAKLGRLKFLFEEGDKTENEYLYEKQKINEEIRVIERQGNIKNMTTAQKEQFIKDTEKYLRDYGKHWNSGLTPEEMREWIKMAIRRIWVKDKRVVAIEPRDDFKALFSAHRKVIAQAPVIALEK